MPVGEIIYMFGGCSDEGEYCTDVFALDTGVFHYYGLFSFA